MRLSCIAAICTAAAADTPGSSIVSTPLPSSPDPFSSPASSPPLVSSADDAFPPALPSALVPVLPALPALAALADRFAFNALAFCVFALAAWLSVFRTLRRVLRSWTRLAFNNVFFLPTAACRAFSASAESSRTLVSFSSSSCCSSPFPSPSGSDASADRRLFSSVFACLTSRSLAAAMPRTF